MSTSFRALLALLLAVPVWGQEKDGAAPAARILALDAEEPEVPPKEGDGGLLIRELVRQGLLVAAREGLGLNTRDRALREAFPDPKGAIQVHTRAIPGKLLQIRLTRDAKPIWEKIYPLKGEPGAPDYLDLVRSCEELSRTDFVEALRAAGYAGKANTVGPKGRASDALERRLAQLTFTDQIAAAREVHQTIRREAESPARLGALVRAYANLGILTEGFFNASAKVFKARALIYAERIAAAYPGQSTSHWFRAYGRALAGLHQASLDDLDAAAAIEAKKPAGDRAQPEWVPWIGAFCRYDSPSLAVAEAGYHDGLLKVLSYLTVEHCHHPTFERARALEAIRASPDSYRLYDSLCEIGGVSNLHEATLLGPRALDTNLWRKMLDVPGLPPAVNKQVEAVNSGAENPPPKATLWDALLKAEDAGEPSWGLLGRLIEEADFVQAWRRGDFMRYKWSVEADDFVKAALEELPAHPYRALIASYGLDHRRQKREWAEAFKGVSLVDANESMIPIINATWDVNAPDTIQGKKAWDLAQLHWDGVARDLVAMIHQSSRDAGRRKKLAHDLLKISPYSPHALEVLIRDDWGFAEPRAADWEKKLGHQPQVMHALGNRYREAKKIDEAERCLKRTMEIAPDLTSYRSLALLYKDQGKTDLWKSTLDTYLETQEEIGLEKANIRVEIARHFMDQKEWGKAAPYAEAAAQTWAGWAMSCARECYEGLEDWAKAELWQQRESERYEQDAYEWFFWCRRTGRGNVDAAREMALERIKSLSGRGPTPSDFDMFGVFHALNGEPKKALEAFRSSFEKTNNPYPGLQAALLAEELKDGATRDALLAQVCEKGETFMQEGKPRTGDIELAKILRAATAEGAPEKPDPAPFLKHLESKEKGARANPSFFVGRFFELRGLKAEAKACYEQAVRDGRPSLWNVALSSAALRSLK